MTSEIMTLCNINERESAAQQLQLRQEITEIERKVEHLNDACDMDLAVLRTYKEMLHQRRSTLRKLARRLYH